MKLDPHLQVTFRPKRRKRTWLKVAVLGLGSICTLAAVTMAVMQNWPAALATAGVEHRLVLPSLEKAATAVNSVPLAMGSLGTLDALRSPTTLNWESPTADGMGIARPDEKVVATVAAAPVVMDADLPRWLEADVADGDTLSSILSRLSLRGNELYVLIDSNDDVGSLEALRPGQHLRILADTDGKILQLEQQISPIERLRISRALEGFEAERLSEDVEKRIAVRNGTISGSFYKTGLDAGMSDKLILELAQLFGWDIDFALDIQPGDGFVVVHEEALVGGEKIGDRAILAAEFINRGKTYRAVRYEDPDGRVHYFTPEGNSMRRSFLRSPVDFRRVSSHFQPNRLHPVLGVKRPHKGVDYAAATGTPIKASGDGVVSFIGRQGGYGNTIVLQHGTRYSTLYAHMNGFARGLSRGERVEQGQIIGYVGSSGMATGPHLHYEFRIDGEHVDPVKVQLPNMPLEEKYLADFRQQTAQWVARLDAASMIRVAQSNQ